LAYALEEPNVAYTMEEFIHETHLQFLGSMTAEERQAFLSQLPPEEVFQRFTPEERLRGLPVSTHQQAKIMKPSPLKLT
jgi:hypothetical protein